jgi:hypothetical protein
MSRKKFFRPEHYDLSILVVRVPPTVHQVRNRAAYEKRRDDQDYDSVSQGLNRAGASGGGTLVTQRASLGGGDVWKYHGREDQNSDNNSQD